MGMPIITPGTGSRDQAITDIIESVALEQTALSHILNAEGEKIQATLTSVGTVNQMLGVNKSVEQMVNSVSRLEMVLQSKLGLFSDCTCPPTTTTTTTTSTTTTTTTTTAACTIVSPDTNVVLYGPPPANPNYPSFWVPEKVSDFHYQVVGLAANVTTQYQIVSVPAGLPVALVGTPTDPNVSVSGNIVTVNWGAVSDELHFTIGTGACAVDFRFDIMTVM